MQSLWGELSAIEDSHHLSFLREPDLGFAWTVHAWARGTSLEKLVGPDLTAGDFVRAVKQLIDLLSQIAVVAGSGAESVDGGRSGGSDLAATARAAIELVRRGVVAYSSVA
jgi:ATP-dependent RNA helicase HelY